MDTLFFVASKTLGALLRAETWIVIALAVTVLALLLERRRLALTVSAVTLVALLLLTILPLGDLLLEPIERRYPANPPLERVDGIIVLGGAEDIDASVYWGQTQLNEAGERFTAAMALARRFPEARVLFTGGSGALRGLGGVPISEAAAAETFFREQGLDPARLILEGRSRNTAENARLSLQLVRPQPEDDFVLVTSASHMPRAIRSFTAAGWPTLTPYPVDFRTSSFASGVGWDLPRNLRVLNTAIREYAGQVVYELTGR
jgi:uncharacterized SAM-binding protein YcdF (DUF218 family)